MKVSVCVRNVFAMLLLIIPAAGYSIFAQDTAVSGKPKTLKKFSHSNIRFDYEDNRKRPVNEFSAIITDRKSPANKGTQQQCAESRRYDPGYYHIVINTFPPTIRNVNLDPDEEMVIGIPQPGFAKFIAGQNTDVAALYLKEGDKYISFYTLHLSDSASQHLQIQPGNYQAHFFIGRHNAPADEQVVSFKIVATKETEVILK